MSERVVSDWRVAVVKRRQPLCVNCEHWTETDLYLQHGHCDVYKMSTEWCAGERIRTPKRVVLCPHFKLKENI